MREVKICRFNGIKLDLTHKEEYWGKILILIKTGTLLIIHRIKMRKRI